MAESKTYRELSEQPGMLMYTGESPVFRGTGEPSVEVVHFIFNTVKNANNVHQAVVVDSEFEIMNNKVLLFASIDEFFGLANYMIRNGIAVSK